MFGYVGITFLVARDAKKWHNFFPKAYLVFLYFTRYTNGHWHCYLAPHMEATWDEREENNFVCLIFFNGLLQLQFYFFTSSII